MAGPEIPDLQNTKTVLSKLYIVLLVVFILLAVIILISCALSIFYLWKHCRKKQNTQRRRENGQREQNEMYPLTKQQGDDNNSDSKSSNEDDVSRGKNVQGHGDGKQHHIQKDQENSDGDSQDNVVVGNKLERTPVAANVEVSIHVPPKVETTAREANITDRPTTAPQKIGHETMAMCSMPTSEESGADTHTWEESSFHEEATRHSHDSQSSEMIPKRPFLREQTNSQNNNRPSQSLGNSETIPKTYTEETENSPTIPKTFIEGTENSQTIPKTYIEETENSQPIPKRDIDSTENFTNNSENSPLLSLENNQTTPKSYLGSTEKPICDRNNSPSDSLLNNHMPMSNLALTENSISDKKTPQEHTDSFTEEENARGPNDLAPQTSAPTAPVVESVNDVKGGILSHEEESSPQPLSYDVSVQPESTINDGVDQQEHRLTLGKFSEPCFQNNTD